MEGEVKNKNGLVWVLVVIIILLIGVVAYFGYLVYQQKDNNVKTPVIDNSEVLPSSSTTTTTTTKSIVPKPSELDSYTLEEFKDVETNATYYLASKKVSNNGDIYDPTEHIIYDANYKKIETIPELRNSHIWHKSGESILNGGKEITAELRGNKIYSLANDSNNQCDFVEYEIYVANGNVVKNIINNYADGTVEVSGEKC